MDFGALVGRLPTAAIGRWSRIAAVAAASCYVTILFDWRPPSWRCCSRPLGIDSRSHPAGWLCDAALSLMLSFAGARFREMSGTVMGTLKVAIPIGGALLPFAMSLVTELSSFQVALLIYPLAMLAGFLLIVAASRASRT
jgi:hypothetical protein